MDIFLCLENWEVVKDTKVRLSFPVPVFYAICTKWMNGISVTNFDHFVTAWELQNFVANLILREINLKNWTTFLLQNWAVKHCKYVFFVKLVDKFAILSVKLIAKPWEFSAIWWNQFASSFVKSKNLIATFYVKSNYKHNSAAN